MPMRMIYRDKAQSRAGSHYRFAHHMLDFVTDALKEEIDYRELLLRSIPYNEPSTLNEEEDTADARELMCEAPY